jgi:hypothetical protein
MKAPALRVLQARIVGKSRDECRIAQQNWEITFKAYETALKIHVDEQMARLEKTVNKNIKKFVVFQANVPKGIHLPVPTQAYNDLMQADLDAYPTPLRPMKPDSTTIEIASLGIQIYVPTTRAEAWVKFTLAVDEAFLSNDVKGILEALDAL